MVDHRYKGKNQEKKKSWKNIDKKNDRRPIVVLWDIQIERNSSKKMQSRSDNNRCGQNMIYRWQTTIKASTTILGNLEKNEGT